MKTRKTAILWGNGGFAVPGQYDYLLRHMASWGFVVIATEDQAAGAGQTIKASPAARRLQGDSYAHGDFVSGTGEMFTETTSWQLVASNIP